MFLDESTNISSSKKELRVALLVPSLEAKGPIIFTQYLIKELKNKVAKIEVFYFKETAKIELGVKCTRISFWKRIAFDEFDIVHTTMAVPDLYAALHVNEKKWISSTHNYLEQDVKMLSKPLKAFLVIFLWKWALKQCKYVIVSSNAMREYYSKLVGDKFFEVIPYGICEHNYSIIEQKDYDVLMKFREKGYTIIGSVGSFIKRKGFAQLVDVLKKNDKLALVIVGDGPEREVVANKCADLGLEHRIYFPGFRNDSYNYYQFIDIYAHVSYSEGFGLAMLEAMSKKIPVVCSKLDIYEEYFTDEDVCYFIPDDSESLNSAFDKVLGKMEQYRQASYNLYAEKFNLNKMADRHIDCYSKVVDKNV